MAAKNKFMNAMKMPAIADIFSSEAERQQMSGDLVTEVPLSELHPFVNHPFEVRDDEDMQKLVDSIKENGVLTNLTVRPRAEGGYEIISGHRRFHAAQLAGLDKIKVQVRDVDDDQAIIDMVDANIQREHISPMEKARAYAMKLEAIPCAPLTSAAHGQRNPKRNMTLTRTASVFACQAADTRPTKLTLQAGTTRTTPSCGARHGLTLPTTFWRGTEARSASTTAATPSAA